MKQHRRGAAAPKGRTRSARAAGHQPPSPWQAPPDLVLGTILERLLAMEDGNRWVRMASHACSFWRSTAQEVLLADTAISKPPLEDFRAIGVQQQQPQQQQQSTPPAKAAKADTVTTQAAVVMEATASTGMEIISKQRFDAPPAVVDTGGGRSGSRSRGARRLLASHAQRALTQQQPQSQQLAGQQPAAARQLAAALPAAASPNRPQRQAAPAEPQGSIQSGMAIGHLAGHGAPESDSDASTRAQAGNAMRRRRRRRSVRSSGRGGSVEQPQRRQPPQEQEEAPAVGVGGSGHTTRAAQTVAARNDGDHAGPSNVAARPRGKRSAGGSEETRPSKRQQLGRQQQTVAGRAEQGAGRSSRLAACKGTPGRAAAVRLEPRAGGASGASPAPVQEDKQAAAARTEQLQPTPVGQAAMAPELCQKEEAVEDGEEGVQQRAEHHSGASGSYYEAEADAGAEQEEQSPPQGAQQLPPPQQAQQAQREGPAGALQLLLHLKRMVGL